MLKGYATNTRATLSPEMVIMYLKVYSTIFHYHQPKTKLKWNGSLLAQVLHFSKNCEPIIDKLDACSVFAEVLVGCWQTK